MTIFPQNLLFRYLDTDGDGTGTKNAIGDYSSAATDFYIQPPAGKIYTIERMLVYIQDTGAFDAEKYGNAVTLTNGVSVSLTTSADVEILDLVDQIPIKTNSGWARQCFDVQVNSWGTGDETLIGRWTFSKTGSPLVLTDQKKFKVTLNDSFAALVAHYFQVQGFQSTDPTY